MSEVPDVETLEESQPTAAVKPATAAGSNPTAPARTGTRAGCLCSATPDTGQGHRALTLPSLRWDDLPQQGHPPGERLAALADARLDR
jgi:hypothetical protein